MSRNRKSAGSLHIVKINGENSTCFKKHISRTGRLWLLLCNKIIIFFTHLQVGICKLITYCQIILWKHLRRLTKEWLHVCRSVFKKYDNCISEDNLLTCKICICKFWCHAFFVTKINSKFFHFYKLYLIFSWIA